MNQVFPHGRQQEPSSAACYDADKVEVGLEAEQPGLQPSTPPWDINIQWSILTTASNACLPHLILSQSFSAVHLSYICLSLNVAAEKQCLDKHVSSQPAE